MFIQAQITINNTIYTTTQLVDGVLVPSGGGTTVSNVAYQGVYNVSNKYQLGYFTTSTTTLAQMGFSSGVVLSTGNTSDIPLAVGADPRAAAQMSTGYTSTCANGEIRQTGSCPVYINDVDVLAGAYNYYNASLLEFDFVPVTNFVKFRYVFGSEEYSDNSGIINYQCSSYNDKFGFLISGPGISGGQGYTNDAKNIARLANGSEVSINSVNNGVVGGSGGTPSASKCQAANAGWVQNVSTAEYLGPIDGTELNGNTRILTAQQNGLTPGQTYHIKLIVTDVTDGAYDAVVYLEAGSFVTTSSANAGVNQSVCSNSANLNAQSPASGTWSVVSGTGSFSNSSSPTSTVTSLSSGPNIFKWSNGIDSANVTITLNGAPSLSAAIGGNITCSHPSTTLTGTSAGATMVWSGGSLINAANPATASASGVYTVVATNSTTGCSASATVNVTTNTISPDASIANPASLTCSVSSVTLTASSTTPNANFNWGSGNTSNSKIVSLTGTYTVTVTDPANGCTATASKFVSAAIGAINFSATTSNATCGNNNGSASVTVSSGQFPYTYLWSNSTTDSIIVNVRAATYSITVTDQGGCSATAAITIDSTNNLMVDFAGFNATCGLNNGVAIATPITGTLPYTFTWSNNANNDTIENLAIGTYTVTVSDGNGCFVHDSIDINGFSVSTLIISSDKSTICAGDTASICATSGFVSYIWNSGKTSECIYATQAGNYYVTATDVNNCTVASNHLALNVFPLPSISISINADTLTAYNSNTYQWYLNSTLLAGANSSVYVASQQGYYTVEVSDSNGCFATSNPIQFIVSGIDEISDNNGISVYPNPINSSNTWNLVVQEGLVGGLCEIADVTGKLIYKKEITDTHTLINYEIKKGIYFLSIHSKRKAEVIKLVKL